ncbi:hypothetical protein POM88_043980 [Heracleum sosnowskyi]|uniref:Xylanase inhibitor C-terminal domain-containing protein n=1 Tax=Heracleum sosnowskyi TaxID=360622 RepID=A0AAD8M3J9_9APIA|nr:hypothetical protein POM88_043980 [Heracleum sosnowskyi]
MKFRKKFTYCIGDIFKSSSRLSFLELGDIEDWDYGDNSMYAPLIHDDYYRIDMDFIEFMETCVGGFNRDIFKYDRNDPLIGVIFDTGAILMFLADEAYDALEDDLARFMRSKGFVEPHYKKDTQMCYEGQKEQISDFPLQ